MSSIRVILPRGDITSSVLPEWILGPIFLKSSSVSSIMGKKHCRLVVIFSNIQVRMRIQNDIGNKHNGFQHVWALRVGKLLLERIKNERRGKDITLVKKWKKVKSKATGQIIACISHEHFLAFKKSFVWRH